MNTGSSGYESASDRMERLECQLPSLQLPWFLGFWDRRREFRGSAVLIFPSWPNQVWDPTLLAQATSHFPLPIHPSSNSVRFHRFRPDRLNLVWDSIGFAPTGWTSALHAWSFFLAYGGGRRSEEVINYLLPRCEYQLAGSTSVFERIPVPFVRESNLCH